ncbi:MAG: hypothetical protein HQ547_03260 [Candidatus Omnitrophica bacterium]|nr:hypothetical protein [Candidatus Omnitrophota bacterium]
MPVYFLTILNKQSHMIVIGFLSVVTGVVLIKFLVQKLSLGIEGVAIATTITYFIYASMLISYAFMHYTKNIFSHLKFFIQLYFPFLWMVGLLVALQIFVFKASGRISEDLSAISFKAVIFLLGWMPLLFYANRKTAVLTLFKEAYLKRKKT